MLGQFLPAAVCVQNIQYSLHCFPIIHPGMINTPMQHTYMKNPEWLKAVLDSIPMGRFGEAEEIAHAALFLASDECPYMTGGELVIDGGFYAT